MRAAIDGASGADASRRAARYLGAALSVALAFAARPATAEPDQLHLSWRGAPATTMVATWRSDAASGECRFGTTTGYELGTVAATAIPYAKITNHLYTAELTGLAPDTSYHYSCGSAALGYSPDATFRTGPGAATPFRFVVFGDLQTYSAAQDANRVAMIAAIGDRFAPAAPAVALLTGDYCDIGGYQYEWDAMFTAVRPLAERTPLMTVVAGHEYIDRVGGTNVYRTEAPEYFAQLVLPTHPTTTGYADEGFYSFDLGMVHFVALGEPVQPPGSSDGGPQRDWLEQDLQSAAADPGVRWIVAYSHPPPYSAGRYSPDGASHAFWVPLFEQYGVALAFWAHNHNYQRTKPLRNDAVVGPGEGGVVHVTAGGMSADVPYECFAQLPAEYELCLERRSFVEVRASWGALEADAVADTGEVLDSFTIAKSGAAPCGDGTPDGQCSPTPPLRCVGGALTPACAACGCPPGQLCVAARACAAPDGGVDGAPPDGAAVTDGGGSDAGADAGDGTGHGGCGCAAARSRPLPALALGALAALRRRRRRG